MNEVIQHQGDCIVTYKPILCNQMQAGGVYALRFKDEVINLARVHIPNYGGSEIEYKPQTPIGLMNGTNTAEKYVKTNVSDLLEVMKVTNIIKKL